MNILTLANQVVAEETARAMPREWLEMDFGDLTETQQADMLLDFMIATLESQRAAWARLDTEARLMYTHCIYTSWHMLTSAATR